MKRENVNKLPDYLNFDVYELSDRFINTDDFCFYAVKITAFFLLKMWKKSGEKVL